MNDEEEEDTSLGTVLKVTREIQRERHRIKGCEVAVTSESVLKAIIEHADRTASELESLEQTFTTETDQDEEIFGTKKLKEDYIEERLNSFRESLQGAQNLPSILPAPEDEPEDVRTIRQKEAELFKTPAHLQQEEKVVNEDSVSESWLTGIQEVELPMSYKIKNIEETERATERLKEEQKSSKKRKTDSIINPRFGYVDHRTQVIKPAPPKAYVPPAAPGQDQPVFTPGPHKQATDGLAYTRFKRHFRY